MNDKSPTKSMLKRLAARIKEIESNAIDQAMKEFLPKGAKRPKSILKKSKGGIVKKNKRGY